MSKKEQTYVNLKYFLESYFNWSTDYADLEKLITEYQARELPVYIRGLTHEIREINEHRNISEIREFVYQIGGRNLSDKKIEQMIDLFVAKLLVENN